MTTHHTADRDAEAAARLQDLLSGRVVVMGVGNVHRGDDGVGPVVAARLQGCRGIVSLDVSTAPEKCIDLAAREKPDTVLVVDAVHWGAQPGVYTILAREEIEASGFTTHDLSLRHFLDMLADVTGAQIRVLAVQPGDVRLAAEMTPDVARAVDEIVSDVREGRGSGHSSSRGAVDSTGKSM